MTTGEIAETPDLAEPQYSRGFISGRLSKKMGLVVESAKKEAGEGTYRIANRTCQRTRSSGARLTAYLLPVTSPVTPLNRLISARFDWGARAFNQVRAGPFCTMFTGPASGLCQHSAGGLRRPSVKGSEGMRSKDSSNEKKIGRTLREQRIKDQSVRDQSTLAGLKPLFVHLGPNPATLWNTVLLCAVTSTDFQFRR